MLHNLCVMGIVQCVVIGGGYIGLETSAVMSMNGVGRDYRVP